jgi:hypothetical protein
VKKGIGDLYACESNRNVKRFFTINRVSRPLVSNRTLRGSDFSSPGLGPREGHAYLVRDWAIKCPQLWLQSCAAGAPFQAGQPCVVGDVGADVTGRRGPSVVVQ